MEVEITKKTEFPMMGRVQVEAKVTFDQATPKVPDVANGIAQKIKSEASLVVVNHLYSDFGRRTAVAHAYAYKDQKSKDLFTIISSKQRVADAKAKFDGVRAKAAEKKAAAEAAAQPASA